MDSSHLETDLHVALEKLVAEDPAFVAAVKRPLITLVAKGDGMNSGPLDYYLKCGHSAINCITEALVRVNRSGASVRSILDFGCGFGRVTRWLLATFPDARLVAMDVDKRAVEAMQTIFSVEAYAIDKGGTALPQLSFDLIWVGSLFTHISAEGSLRLLQLLQGMLNFPSVSARVTTQWAFRCSALKQPLNASMNASSGGFPVHLLGHFR